jgi:pyrimidine operon attenuation protein/uracil phosphoribosyltransferase
MAPASERILAKEEMAAQIGGLAASILSSVGKGRLKSLAFLGIQLKGVPLSSRLASEIKSSSGVDVPVGTLDISMYRDDIGFRKTLPRIYETEIPFELDGRIIVLTDDVLHTGRTIRAALDAITHFGRPDMIRLAVLLDRGMREFPIQADFAGSLWKVPASKKVEVKWVETDGEDAVYLSPTGKSSRRELVK